MSILNTDVNTVLKSVRPRTAWRVASAVRASGKASLWNEFQNLPTSLPDCKLVGNINFDVMSFLAEGLGKCEPSLLRYYVK